MMIPIVIFLLFTKIDFVHNAIAGFALVLVSEVGQQIYKDQSKPPINLKNLSILIYCQF
jgi:hypothetical protein